LSLIGRKRGSQPGTFDVFSFVGFLWEMGIFTTPGALSSLKFLAAFKLPALLALHSIRGEKQ
jgi:hypothetical protein